MNSKAILGLIFLLLIGVVGANTAPVLSSVTTDKSTYNVGETVTFNATFSDAEWDNVKLLVDDSITFANCSYSENYGCIAYSSLTNTSPVTATMMAAQTTSWSAKVCDSLNCSSVTSGTFYVENVTTTTTTTSTTSTTIPSNETISWQEDVRVTSDNATSENPSFAIDSNKNIHISWVDYRDGNYEIYYSKLDSDGNTLVDDTRITSANGISNLPQIAVDFSNNVHLVWSDARDVGYRVYYTKLDSNGSTLIDDTRLTSVDGDSLGAEIAIDSNDNIHVVWSDQRDSVYGEIYYKKLDNNGTTLVNDIQLTNNNMSSEEPSIAIDSYNKVHVAWADNRDGDSPPSCSAEVYYTKLDNNGNTVIDDTRLTNLTDNPTGCFGDVSVSLDSNDNLHLTWYAYPTVLEGGPNIYYMELNNNGTKVINDTQLTETQPDYYAYHSTIALDSNDNVYIIWGDDREQASGPKKPYYTKLDNNGNTVIDDTKITNTSWSNPKTIIDSDNNIYVTYWGSQDGNYEIYYKKGALNATTTTTTTTTSTTTTTTTTTTSSTTTTLPADDTTPPTLTARIHPNTGNYSTIYANATDDVGMLRMDLYANGAYTDTKTCAGIFCYWEKEVWRFTEGNYTYMIMAYDTSYNNATEYLYASISGLRGDSNLDGTVNDFELLDSIDFWAEGVIDDFYLLDVIDNWVATG